MTYHHLHRFTYHHRPSSLISAENLESNSDNTNRQIVLPSTSSTPTAILIQVQNKTRRKKPKSIYSQAIKSQRLSPSPSPSAPVLTQPMTIEKPSNPFLVDYCTYHDVAVARVTCL